MMGLVMLALLASALPVHAEKSTLWSPDSTRSRNEQWHKVRQAATEAECWARFDTLKLPDVDADVIRTVVDGQKTTAYYRDGTKYVVEFTCLPDTMDPRRAKGK